jgi:hypothetical protein
METHQSSHLISVIFQERKLLEEDHDMVKQLLEDYVNSVIGDIRIKFCHELEKRFIVNVIKTYNKQKKCYSNLFAYIWCSKEVYDIFMRRTYIKVYDIPKKISEEQEKICNMNVCWGDYDDDEEIDYDELLKPKDIQKSIFFKEEEIIEKTKKYLEEAEKNAIKLGERPYQELFKFEPMSCNKCSKKDANRRLKMTNYLNKGAAKVRSKLHLIDKVEEYIKYVPLYDNNTLKHEYPKVMRTQQSFEVEFPKEETCFAQKFFQKVIIEKGSELYIGFFDFNE